MTPEELRARRKVLNLSQIKLAEALGVTQHTISRWEEGKMKLSAPRSLWLDVEMKRVERERRSKRRNRTPTPPAAPREAHSHPFVPLSGSQGSDGEYQRCGVHGCALTSDQHAYGRPAQGEAP